MLIWSQSNGLWSNNYTSATGWSVLPQQLDTSGDTDQNPQLAIDAQGNAMVVWSNSAGLQAKYYSISNGWDANTTVIQSVAGDVASPHIGFDANGNALAMWFQDGDPTVAIRWDVTVNQYIVNNLSWSTAQRYDTLTGGTSVYKPYIKHAIDAAGNALVMWSDISSGYYELKAGHYLAGTGWEATSTLGVGSSGDVAVGSSGNGIVVWMCNDPADQNTICSRRYSIAGGWSASAGHKTEWTVYASVEPVLASNAAGNAFVVWTELYHMAAYRFP
jgi:hypothetical protein